jgi:hypothetical protein
MGRLINKRSETPKKKKASGKAAARKPTGKGVGRKSDIDTTKTMDPTAKTSVVCRGVHTVETDGKKAGGLHCRRGDISEAEMEFLDVSALHRGSASYSLPARLHWTRARRG